MAFATLASSVHPIAVTLRMGVFACTSCGEKYTDVRFIHEEYAARKDGAMQPGKLDADPPVSESAGCSEAYEKAVLKTGDGSTGDHNAVYLNRSTGPQEAESGSGCFAGIARTCTQRQDNEVPPPGDDSASTACKLEACDSDGARSAAHHYPTSARLRAGADTDVALRFPISAEVRDHDGDRCRVVGADQSDQQQPCELDYPDGTRYWSAFRAPTDDASAAAPTASPGSGTKGLDGAVSAAPTGSGRSEVDGVALGTLGTQGSVCTDGAQAALPADSGVQRGSPATGLHEVAPATDGGWFGALARALSRREEAGPAADDACAQAPVHGAACGTGMVVVAAELPAVCENARARPAYDYTNGDRLLASYLGLPLAEGSDGGV